MNLVLNKRLNYFQEREKIKMQEKLEKYADLLLDKCLNLKDNEPLFIQGPIERYDFIRVLASKAYNRGIKDIHFKLSDAYIKHDELLNLSIKELQEKDWWSGKDLDEYAKKGAAFLSLAAEYPDLMDDIDSNKLITIQKSMINESQTFDKRRQKNELSWCIAAVPTKDWADKLFPNENDNVNKLWNIILDIAQVTQSNPIKSLDQKIMLSRKRAEKLNNMKIKYFKYQNSLGTNLTIEMPNNYIFHNIEMQLQDGRIILPNIPSEEIYSSPKKDGVNGIVYASKPLIHNGKYINDFYLEFKNGKVINFDAKEGKDSLKEIINFDENSCYLGEIALVEYDSPISNTNILFYTTLFDENASCHFALGQSFSDCVVKGELLDENQLEEIGLNQSKLHVDFMVGTKDLNIKAITENNQEIIIFKDGNFVI